MIAVRRAVPADASALAALRWEWMRRELEPGSGAWQCWVAEEDRPRIVGQVWLQLLTKVPNPVGERDRHAYLSNLYVVPDARGGIGRQLLEAALDWANQHRVDRVVLWPTERSRTLYERHGFVRVGDVMELTL